ncbi:hypothetical protein MASR1M59_14610 [Melaminivora sp.]
MAAPLHLRQQRAGHQSAGRGIGLLLVQLGGQGGVDVAQQARIGERAKQGEGGGGAQGRGAASALVAVANKSSVALSRWWMGGGMGCYELNSCLRLTGKR